MTIAFKYVSFIQTASGGLTGHINREKMKVPANVLDQLVQSSQSDIRQVLNMLSTWKLSNSTMDFDQGKNLYVLFTTSVGVATD